MLRSAALDWANRLPDQSNQAQWVLPTLPLSTSQCQFAGGPRNCPTLARIPPEYDAPRSIQETPDAFLPLAIILPHQLLFASGTMTFIGPNLQISPSSSLPSATCASIAQFSATRRIRIVIIILVPQWCNRHGSVLSPSSTRPDHCAFTILFLFSFFSFLILIFDFDF